MIIHMIIMKTIIIIKNLIIRVSTTNTKIITEFLLKRIMTTIIVKKTIQKDIKADIPMMIYNLI